DEDRPGLLQRQPEPAGERTGRARFGSPPAEEPAKPVPGGDPGQLSVPAGALRHRPQRPPPAGAGGPPRRGPPPGPPPRPGPPAGGGGRASPAGGSAPRPNPTPPGGVSGRGPPRPPRYPAMPPATRRGKPVSTPRRSDSRTPSRRLPTAASSTITTMVPIKP